jgi:hypothetical protein
MSDPFQVSKASRDDKSVAAVGGGALVAGAGYDTARYGSLKGRRALSSYTLGVNEGAKAREIMPKVRDMPTLRTVAAHRDAADKLAEQGVKSYKTARRIHRGGKAAIVGGVGAIGAGIYGLSTPERKKTR